MTFQAHSTHTFSTPFLIEEDNTSIISLHSITTTITLQRTSLAETDKKVNLPIGRALTTVGGYPTPPASPELDDHCDNLPESPKIDSCEPFITVQLDDLDHLDQERDDDDDSHDSDAFDEGPSIDYDLPHRPTPQFGLPQTGLRIPIPVILDTSHDLPQPATFRLRSPASLLALVSGQRVVTLDSNQTLWDRMPYSAAAAAIHARQPTEEDVVERMISDTPEKRPNGLQWAMRQK